MIVVVVAVVPAGMEVEVDAVGGLGLEVDAIGMVGGAGG